MPSTTPSGLCAVTLRTWGDVLHRLMVQAVDHDPWPATTFDSSEPARHRSSGRADRAGGHGCRGRRCAAREPPSATLITCCRGRCPKTGTPRPRRRGRVRSPSNPGVDPRWGFLWRASPYAGGSTIPSTRNEEAVDALDHRCRAVCPSPPVADRSVTGSPPAASDRAQVGRVVAGPRSALQVTRSVAWTSRLSSRARGATAASTRGEQTSEPISLPKPRAPARVRATNPASIVASSSAVPEYAALEPFLGGHHPPDAGRSKHDDKRNDRVV